jgi:hypothetical protein
MAARWTVAAGSPGNGFCSMARLKIEARRVDEFGCDLNFSTSHFFFSSIKWSLIKQQIAGGPIYASTHVSRQ